MNARARIATLLSSIALVAALLPASPALADDTPTPSPTPVAPAPAAAATSAPEVSADLLAFDIIGTPQIHVGAASLSTDPASALVTNVPATLTYRWMRTGVAIPGATAATYVPVAADNTKGLTVEVTVHKAGYTNAVLVSVEGNYSIYMSAGTGSISGTPTTGNQFAASSDTYSAYSGPDPLPAPHAAYQWLRQATTPGAPMVVISGATSSTYRLTAADVGNQILVRMTISSAPFAPLVQLFGPTTPILPGVFGGSQVISITGPTASRLGVSIPAGTITDTAPETGAPVYHYQWLRNGANIAGATAATYLLTAADYNTSTGVRVSVTKPGYTQVDMTDTGDFSLKPNEALSGLDPIEAYVGGTLDAGGPYTYDVALTPVAATVAYQWLRDGVAIAGAAAKLQHYTPVAADSGHALAARITATYLGYPANILTTAPTQKIAAHAFFGIGSPLTVTACCINGKLTVADPGLDPVGTNHYQWLRNNAAITGATAASYTLTAADLGTLTSVRVTTTKTGYTPVVKVSTPKDYSVNHIGVPTIDSAVTGLYRVGDTVSVVLPTYLNANGSIGTPTVGYTWYRNGVAIAGQTSQDYIVQPGDFNMALTARVIASIDSLNASNIVTAPTPIINTGTLVVNGSAQPVVTDTAGVLSAALPAGTVTTPQVFLSYQWFRQTGVAPAVPITGATHQTYAPAAADLDKKISVRIVVSKLHVLPSSVVLPISVGIDYSIKAVSPFLVTGTNQVGEVLTAADGPYTNQAGDPIVPARTYQWLRAGVAIAGQTSSTHTLVAADAGKAITVRVTASLPGLVSRTIVGVPAPVTTQLGVIVTSAPPQVSAGTLNGQLVAAMPAGSITTPGVALSYQWLRNDVAIAGATTNKFTLASTDGAKDIRVRITLKKTGYVTLPLASNAVRYGLQVLNDPALSGLGNTVGEAANVTGGDYRYVSTGAIVFPAVRTYQWFRKTGSAAPVAIPGATTQTYVLALVDLGKVISVRETVAGPAMVPFSTFAVLDTIQPGENQSDGTVAISLNPATDTLTASLAAGSLQPATPAPVLTYQWQRESADIPGATHSTYVLTEADRYYFVSAVITVHRAGFVTADASYELVDSNPKHYSAFANGGPSFSVTPVFGVSYAAPPLTWIDYDFHPLLGTPVVKYQWYRTDIASGPGTLIAGATHATYTPTAADVGHYLHFTFSGKFPGDVASPSIASGFSPQVVPAALGWTGFSPTVGVANPTTMQLKVTVPSSLFAVAPTSYTYQWARKFGSDPIDEIGTNSPTYTLTQNEVGASIQVLVTAHRAGYADQAMLTTLVEYSLFLSGGVTLSIDTGTSHTGSVITAVPGTLQPNVPPVTYSYQWWRNAGAGNVKITGATHATYTVVAADVNNEIWVTVHVTKPGYLTPTAQSSIANIPSPANIVGNPLPLSITQAGSVLTGHLHTAGVTTPGVTFTYKWFHNNVEQVGATALTFHLPADHSGNWRFAVTWSKPGYFTTTSDVTITGLL